MPAAWPTSVADDTVLYLAKNNLYTSLNGAINAAVTTITLTDASNFPTSGFVSIDNEVISYTGKSTNDLTGCTRGADGTSAASHTNGRIVMHRIVAAHHNALKDEVIAIENSLNLTASRLIVTNGSGRLAVSAVTATEAGYLSGVTSAIQTQLNAKITAGAGAIVNADVNAAAAIAYSKLNLATSIVNADINGSAAIAVSKLAALTASRAVVSDGSGFLAVSAATATEVGYLSGVTSAIQTQLNALPQADGWTSSADTWTYASASSFTIAGVDRTTVFKKGTRLKFTNSTVKYATVESSSFSTNTTVNIIVNTDYVLTNTTISSPYYSYQAAPQGYPSWFAYTPSWTSTGTTPAIGNGLLAGRYRVIDGAVQFQVAMSAGSTTTFGTGVWRFTVPTAAANNATLQAGTGCPGVWKGSDTGTADLAGFLHMISTTAFQLGADLHSGGTAAQITYADPSTPMTWVNGDQFSAQGTYEF